LKKIFLEIVEMYAITSTAALVGTIVRKANQKTKEFEMFIFKPPKYPDKQPTDSA